MEKENKMYVDYKVAPSLNNMHAEIAQRPTGTKHVLDLTRQIKALQEGPEGIDKLKIAPHKLTKGTEEIVQV